MPKALVIAEKPSVAQDIARALDVKVTKGSKYFENDDYLITSASGHLLEMEEEGGRKSKAKKKSKKKSTASKNTNNKKEKKPSKWSLDSLPSIPDKFELWPTKDGKDLINLIKKLVKRDDIDYVINACDAGREGELIFHNIYSYLKPNKKVKRLWLQSMTPKAIRDGFAKLRKEEEFAGLREAAIARSQADWLVGINATRAFTALNSKDGGFVLTNAGRVQTPTLALLVSREQRRRDHVPEKYWTINASFLAAAGDFEARWVQHGASKLNAKPKGKGPSDRIFDKKDADRIKALLEQANATGEASDKMREKTLRPPSLFDLNSLQREANRKHSMPARATLRAAQALYERYKLITYPRTESRYLPTDYVEVSSRTLRQMSKATPHLKQFLEQSSDGVEKVKKKVFDNEKITDHFAIIPTGVVPPASISEPERKVYELVIRRFVAAFMQEARIQETLRTIMVGEERFEARGSVVKEAGWFAAAGPQAGDKTLPALAGEKEIVKAKLLRMDEKQTNPPVRYDDGTLLGAMQGAYRFIKDEDELAEALKEGGGLGTPATRAEIIEELIRNGYITRNNGELIPTARAFSLIELCNGMGIDDLTKPRLTGEWESRLKKVEQGDGKAEQFLSEIKEMVTNLVTETKTFDPDSIDGDYTTLEEKCPRKGCGGAMAEGPRKYFCEKCKYFFWKIIAGRAITPLEAEELLRHGKIGPYDDFISRFLAPFSATLLLDKETGKLTFEFADDRDSALDESKIETLEKIGKCPKQGCGGNVLVAEASYLCEKSVGKSASCDFRLGKVICKRDITTDEAVVLFDRGKSEFLQGFVSRKRRGRKFGAHLTFDEQGKLIFEFKDKEKESDSLEKAEAKNA